jgi:hypothetical protein
VPAGAKTEFPLDAGGDVQDYWGPGRAATYDDCPLLGREMAQLAAAGRDATLAFPDAR